MNPIERLFICAGESKERAYKWLEKAYEYRTLNFLPSSKAAVGFARKNWHEYLQSRRMARAHLSLIEDRLTLATFSARMNAETIKARMQ